MLAIISNNIKTLQAEARVRARGSGYLTFFKQQVLVTIVAAVTEVSRSSMQLEVDEEIELGSRIELGLQRLIVQGEIDDCAIADPGRYRLNVLTHKVFEVQRAACSPLMRAI